MDKFGSVIDRTCMKLGNNFLNSLRVENQHVIVVDGATHSQKMVWRVTEAPWKMERMPLCCSCAALRCFCGLVSSQYLILMR